jgi:hypothetical protein
VNAESSKIRTLGSKETPNIKLQFFKIVAADATKLKIQGFEEIRLLTSTVTDTIEF